jgi:hypothetical protein
VGASKLARTRLALFHKRRRASSMPSRTIFPYRSPESFAALFSAMGRDTGFEIVSAFVPPCSEFQF